jgi:sterol desaturase/sphingolipid hydroxylase (fatty acid hydroxylase superfamily)
MSVSDFLMTLADSARTFWPTMLSFLAGFAVAFGILSKLMPCNPGLGWWKDLRATATDAVYWLILPLLLGVCRTLMLAAGISLLFDGREPDILPVKDMPLWQQCLVILVIQDVMLYWIHRAFHGRLAWKFHAVHHSPQELDWTSTLRFHPLNNLLAFALVDVIVLLLGFSREALIAMTPFNLIYAAMVHANLNWTFGPLRFVFASPVFHRWHHTSRAEGLNKNFASTFPILDMLFGTFYMPPGKLPEQFGSGDPDFPRGFWGQLLYPFRASRPEPVAPARPTPARRQKKRAA